MMTKKKKDYATFSEIFEEILNDAAEDPKLALAILQDQITPIKKSKDMPEDDKDILLNQKIPSIRSQIEKKLEAYQEEEKKAKRKNSSSSISDGILDEDMLYYASLDDEYEEDQLEEEESLTWEDINPDLLDYPSWLHEVGLRTFFPLQEETLFKIVACIALVNSAAIPTRTPSFTTEGELPLIYLFGKPQTGKGSLADWLGNHYLFSTDSKVSAYQAIGDQLTLNALRDTFDSVCNLGDGILREACVHVNDFDPDLVVSGTWSKSKAPFLAVKRSEAIARVSKNGRRSQDVQGEFWMWCLKILSSNNHPKELISTLKGKFDRRIICIPVEERGSGLNKYNWGTLRDEYQKIWKGNVSEYRRKYLRPILRKEDTEFTPIPLERVNQSRVLISVGLFTGIFQSFEQACNHFGTYWEYIQAKYMQGQDDLFLASLEAFVAEKENARLALKTRKSFVGQNSLHLEIDLDTIHLACTQGGNKEKERNKIVAWMKIQGYEKLMQHRGGKHTFYFAKDL